MSAGPISEPAPEVNKTSFHLRCNSPIPMQSRFNRYDQHVQVEQAIDSVVGAAAVEHDVFDRGAGLRGDALKRAWMNCP